MRLIDADALPISFDGHTVSVWKKDLDAAPTVNPYEWISVEERLPERNGRYLTHCKIEGQSLVCILYYCKVGGFNEGTVTHWMPLPEAPKMKGGAE